MPRKTTNTKLITIEEQPDTRTVRVGLHRNGATEQRVIELHEPNMVAFGDLQAAGTETDRALPPMPVIADVRAPTSTEIAAQAEAVREQNLWCYGPERPYGKLFLKIVSACSDEDVAEEEIPSWGLAPQASRRVLDFFKSLSDGPGVAELLAATPPPEKS